MQDVCDITHKQGEIKVKKLRSASCLLALLLLAPLLIYAWHKLPVDNSSLAAGKYAGWSGVLQLWIYEGWAGGSGQIAPWLNRCISSFEKAHPGVYVQPQYVDADALASFHDSGIFPPDMVLFPPGLLDSPEGLIPLQSPVVLPGALDRCGQWDGSVYAMPVAMGGYLWARNRALLDDIPSDWQEVGVPLATPEPESWRRWDLALLALCAGHPASSQGDGPVEVDIQQSALDLGLAQPSATAPEATPAPSAPAMPCRLPEDFSFSKSAWQQFINGDAAAIPVTQREVNRLRALSDQGRGPDWQLCAGDAAFTDQLLCLGIVARPDAKAQRELCLQFMSHLLEDDCQNQLWRASAFSVTGVPSGYGTGDPLVLMDTALHSHGLVVPGCFGSGWIEHAKLIVRDFIDNTRKSTELWAELVLLFSENPNIR